MQNTQHFSPSELKKLSDKELYKKCRMYGEAARIWRQKFIGLLPEVNRRRLYEKKGFSSIFEFAAKLCGLSAEQVRLTLNLEKRFEDKPTLKKMLENGEVSVNKLARVVSIVTSENEKELAEKIKILPKNALETLVRDAAAENKNGSSKPLFGDKDLPGQILNFELSDDIKEQLNELHLKGIDVNELLREMLKKRQEEITEGKEKIAEKIQPTTSRYIPTKTKKILQKEFGGKCSIAACQKSATIIHHTQRFGLSQNHDPRFLAPLCKGHHVIAHGMDFKYQWAKGKGLTSMSAVSP